MALHFHECDRFRKEIGQCPFRRFVEDDDDDEEDEERKSDALKIPFMLPARSARDADLERRGSASNPLLIFPDLVTARRKELERMAAIQRGGELESIPDFRDFPLGGRGLPETISVLTAIALMRVFGKLRSGGPINTSRAVRTAERVSARGLRQLGIGRPASARPGIRGRGGFHVNAAADLKFLFQGVVNKRLLDGTIRTTPNFGGEGVTGGPF